MKSRTLVSLQFLVLFFALASSALANTYYVDGVNGNDNNNCQSATSACQTISHAISLAVSGDTIMVAPAIYHGTLFVTTSVSIIGAGAANTIISGSNNQNYDAVVVIPNQSPQLVVSLSGLTIQDAVAVGETNGGNGVLNYGKLIITNSVITKNAAGLAFGGGINNYGFLTLNKSTISGNSARNGGGIACGGSVPITILSMNINNSTISNNVAGTEGGGIYTVGCPTTITNSTITGNSLQPSSDPVVGGIYSFSTVFINNTTISSNMGGIYVQPKSTTKIQNSILSDNSPTGEFVNCAPFGSLTSDGYNISDDASCKFSSSGDMNTTDPMLGPLQNNGGATMTMAISPGSPAIDAGNPAGCTDGHGHLLPNDERGKLRPGDPSLKTGCDIGAYEYQFPK
jgi:hypothetical protein